MGNAYKMALIIRLLFITAACSCALLYAETRQVYGTVRDLESGLPIVGVNS